MKRFNYIYDEIHELTIKDIIMFITVMIFVMNFTIINCLGYRKYNNSFIEEVVLLSYMVCFRK